MKKIGFCFFIFLSILRGDAQNDNLVSKNFKFKDGVYLHFENLQRNQPSAIWDSVEARLATNPQTLQMYIELIKYKNRPDSVDLNKLWCVVIDGIPYSSTPPPTASSTPAARPTPLIHGTAR